MPQRTYVLHVDAVKDAIDVLQSTPVHETFPAYLHLRHRVAVTGRWSDLGPEFQEEAGRWLRTPGGPPGKPYFRPFVSRGTSYWLNPNLAGSYQASSLRPDIRTLYLDTNGVWRLPTLTSGEPDVAEVSDKLLKGRTIRAWALSAFLYRNRSFTADSDDAPDWQDLLDLFQDQFKWSDTERARLFTWDHPVSPAFEEVDA